MFVDFVRRLNAEGRRWLEIVPDPVPVFLAHHVVFFTGIDLGGCDDCCTVRRRLRTGSAGAGAGAGRKAGARALDECSAVADCSAATDDLQDDVMHKVHIQLHAAHDAIRIQVRRHPAAAETFGVAALERIAVTWRQVSDTELGHWVTGSVGHSGHLSRPGHRVIIFYPV